ncbi:Uncharacterized protein APZ42_014441 [Daphnia magna]|uniref:Uncharacterized protein n=1 Tax=Daphnia magna TaxID=35525 RepID=A0A162PW64_9CRUS|nr:Uncharacterized protein APZ42_014441 [Daphnia magna]
MRNIAPNSGNEPIVASTTDPRNVSALFETLLGNEERFENAYAVVTTTTAAEFNSSLCIVQVAIETYKQQLEELEINKNQQIQKLETENGELQDTINNLKKEIEGMNNIELEIPLQQQTNIILDPNNNEEDSTSHTHESEDESDVTNLQNNELTKYPTTQPFTIPLRIKQHLEKKVNEIVSEDWTIDTIKNSKYTIYKFTSELMSSIFTNEYLKSEYYNF